MRGVAVVLLATLALPLAISACGDKAAKRAAADARAANFVPPSVLARADFARQIARRFRRLDRDSDDVIEAVEIPAGNQRIAGLDRNGDGEITMPEFSEGLLARFDGTDANKDGTVTSNELAAAKAAL